MKINLKKLFVTAIIGGGLFVAQPAQAFYYDTSNIYNYTNDVINTTRNYFLQTGFISMERKKKSKNSHFILIYITYHKIEK